MSDPVPDIIGMNTKSEVAPPETGREHPDRHLSCQEAIEPAFQELAGIAESAGWSETEVAAALVDLADNHILALAANAETDAELNRLNSCQKS